MSSEISKFIKNVPVESLKTYFYDVHSDLAVDVDWDSDYKSIRNSLLAISEKITGEKLVPFQFNSDRLTSQIQSSCGS